MSKEQSSYLTSLVDRCLSGDNLAWGELICRISPLVHKICYETKLSRDEHFDILGQVLLLLLKNLKNVRSPEKLPKYVKTTTQHEIREYMRKSNYLNRMQNNVADALYSGGTPAPDTNMENSQAIEALFTAMAKLPLLCHELLTALFFDSNEPSYQELSQKLGIPVSSIGPTRMRCLDKLRKLMDKK